MYSNWLRALNELIKEREARFRDLLNEVCSKALVVALFGSRAKGSNTPLSDWDLLAIIPTGQYKIEAKDIGQVVWLPLDKLDEVLEYSMIILDAVIDGKVLCGDHAVFENVKSRVKSYIEEKGLVRTAIGWVKRVNAF